ncbi:MAG: PEP-CTERM sorting domain-containing protein [Sedimentisphaerales bacterium]|nr:PEP-CTERM sorting domain-containing protein [Sedimentisphaerales bacterium]
MKKLVVLLAVVCFASGAFATTYNMTSGWESSNWSYGCKVETGYSTGAFGAFIPGVQADLDPGNLWLERWGDAFGFQETGAYQTWVGKSLVDIWIPLNKVTAQPWVVWAAAARFSGAEAGTYDLSSAFKGIGAGATPVGNRIVYVQKNGGTIWSSALVGYDTVSNAQQVTLASGDYLDFIVTDAQNYSNGAATMDATLTLVPEPATMILLGLGGLLLRKRK